MKKVLCTMLIVACAFAPLPANASAFNPNALIEDYDFFRTDEMSVDDVQVFLERKGSALASLSFGDADGFTKKAAELIHQSALRHGINPKVLLVLLQKEQSLIENPSPSQYNLDWATGFARCDSCLASDPALAKYKGFAVQVERAAWRSVYYTTHPEEFQSRPLKPIMIDGSVIVPQNAATAALYNYTPHLKGNYSFWKLWNRYFSRAIPDGSVVQRFSDPDIWLIQDGKRRLFESMGAFLSRKSISDILPITSSDLEKYPIGEPIRFPLYSLLQKPNGAVFLYADGGLYGIPSKKIFRSIGFHPDEIIRVSDQEIDQLGIAGLLNEDRMQSPMGELIQDTRSGGIYYLQHSVKHPLLERAVLASNFSLRRIRGVSTEVLEKIETGTPVLFEDGTLVTEPSSSAVFVISNGLKRPFASADTFTTLGYKWENIISSNGRTLEHHRLGAMIDLGSDENGDSFFTMANL